MRSWKKYPKYKDSGVEWLGEIPESWKSVAIRHISIVKRGASPRPIDDPKYFDDNGEYAWVRISDVSASSRYLEQTTQKLSDIGQKFSVCLEPGEIFLSMAGSIGKVIITKIKCCIHDGFVYFVNLKENRDFLYYIFQCNQMYIGLGKLGTQLNLNTDTIGDIKISLPPLPEQTAIASFLDRETTRIDALIEKKQRQIELLQEKRAALISQAVTKGLDPTVPMKDSGVPWLGEVPEHWAYQPMGYIISIQPGYSFNSDDYSETGIRLLKISNVAFGDVAWDDLTYLPFEYISKYQLFSLNDGDIVMAMTRPVISGGIKVSIVSADDIPSLLNQRVCRLVAGTNISSKFLYYTLISSTFVSYISELLFSTNQPNLSADEIKKFKCLLPSINEQTKIVQFLDKELRSITQIVDLINLSILTLQEYRSALISAAVTGKIDVRNEATA